MPTKISENAAIATLERHIVALAEGVDSIPEQEERIGEMRASLARAEQHLEDSKVAYVELTEALSRLRA